MNYSFTKKVLLERTILIFLFFAIPLVIYWLSNNSKRVRHIDIQFEKLTSLNDIHPIRHSPVIPFVYINTLSFKNLSSKQKKQKFIDLMLPAILVSKYKIDQDKIMLDELKNLDPKDITAEDSLFLAYLFKKYSSVNIYQLERKVRTHPVSIVLAQAAMESGWGTSSFFVDANNAFGIWASENTKNKIKASATRKGKPVYLRKYANLSSSIDDYFMIISKTPAYRKFREKRIISDKPEYLIKYLNKYSEMGIVYTKRLKRVVRQNHLTRYDKYEIDPKYLD